MKALKTEQEFSNPNAAIDKEIEYFRNLSNKTVKGRIEILSVSSARQNLPNLINEMTDGHRPVYIKGKKNNVVLMSANDYTGMVETMYLMSIPGHWESIVKASNAPDSEFLTEEQHKEAVKQLLEKEPGAVNG